MYTPCLFLIITVISLEVKRKFDKYQKVSNIMSMIVPLVRISVILDPHFAGIRAPKIPKKGHFVDAESVRKSLKNFNLATTNAIQMKLTTISIFMRV